MTNGEKIKELYPRVPTGVRLDEDGTDGTMTFTTNKGWWNAEYVEPIIQELQAESDKFDAAFQDGYDQGYAQARFDYDQEPTAKNDLVSRNVVERIIKSPRTKEQMLLVLNSLPSQEPFINKPCVSSGVCEHDKNKVLDKIRAEIETKYGQCDICEYFEDYDYEENDISEYRPIGNIADILQILDKYKAGSEEING